MSKAKQLMKLFETGEMPQFEPVNGESEELNPMKDVMINLWQDLIKGLEQQLQDAKTPKEKQEIQYSLDQARRVLAGLKQKAEAKVDEADPYRKMARNISGDVEASEGIDGMCEVLKEYALKEIPALTNCEPKDSEDTLIGFIQNCLADEFGLGQAIEGLVVEETEESKIESDTDQNEAKSKCPGCGGSLKTDGSNQYCKMCGWTSRVKNKPKQSK